MNEHVTDPVCGMEVDRKRIHTAYRGVEYGFCSVQCRRRFLANPRLYVGEPGRKAPRQDGVEIIKKRRLHLTAPLSQNAAAVFEEALESIVGVKQAHVFGVSVALTYDLVETTAETIEDEIASIGVKIGAGWGDRLRRAFVHLEEACELENLVADDKHCCEVRKT